MQISVIIPTCNRVSRIEQALKSLLEQTIIPDEIIIVDDSDGKETEEMLKPSKQLAGRQVQHDTFRVQHDNEWQSKTKIKYIRRAGEKSVTMSLNMGMENATGEIIFFFDDDVILDKDYIKEILKTYDEKPNALGVQGYITNRRKSAIRTIVNRFFFLVHSEKNINRLLPSMQNVYADPLDKIINCQWMVGNNMSFKKEISSMFNFDNKLTAVQGWGADQDFSYRIYKTFPFSFYQTPFAKLFHKGGMSYGSQSEKRIHRMQVTQLYLFYKNMDRTLRNKLIFLWSRIGLLLIAFGVTILRRSEAKGLRPLHLIEAYIFCMKHLDKIRRGKLEFFNRML